MQHKVLGFVCFLLAGTMCTMAAKTEFWSASARDPLASPGLLKTNTYQAELKTHHKVDLQNQLVTITRFLDVSYGGDTVVLEESFYPIDSYTLEINSLALPQLWQAQFAGQANPNAGGGNKLEWELPVEIPTWLKRFGLDKPKLKVNGSYTVNAGITFSRNSEVGDNIGWNTTPNLEHKPFVSIVGSIGRLIHIEINSEEGFGNNLTDQLKISYRGKGNELEDNIIQEIEAGNTSLALPGTNLTGYTESHKGLFGIKTRLKFGNLQVTTIASTEGGSQERQTLGASKEERTISIEEKQMSLYRHFFLELQDREAYQDSLSGVGTAAYRSEKRGIQVHVWTLSTDPEAKLGIAYPLDNSRQLDSIQSSGLQGRWKKLDPTEYTYNSNLRMLTLNSGYSSLAIAVRWSQDPLATNSNPIPVPSSGLRDAGNATSAPRENTLILLKREVPDVVLDPLMWRNVYNIGNVAPEDRNRFKLNVIQSDNSSSLSGQNTFTQLLGLTKNLRSTDLDLENEDIFNFDQGLLVLPCFVADSSGFRSNQDGLCLEPFKRVNSETEIYSRKTDDIQNIGSTHEIQITSKQTKSTFRVNESSHSVSGGQCLDITEGTERLVLNGSTVLERGKDYEVLYEIGQISLTSQRAKAPNADIEISYQCKPIFEIQDKVLVGTRLEYDLDNISKESMMGATFLYKSQTTTSEIPQIGNEPFEQFLWGFNTRLSGQPKWMTRVTNQIPFVQTDAPSLFNFEFEVAQSYYNPNPKGKAFLDDFENSERNYVFPLDIDQWHQASPPGNEASQLIFNEDLDYRHMGEFVWHSNIEELFSRIYGNTSSTQTNNSLQPILKLSLQPNDNFRGNSWGGTMRSLPDGLRDQTEKRVLEVVLFGQNGTVHLDLGRISEDVSIGGNAPNGTLNSEVFPGESINKNDFGLDGLPDEEERGKSWQCTPECFSQERSAGSSDPNQDNWEPPVRGQTDQGKKVNGTQGNDIGKNGFTYDTEDLTGNGSLDRQNIYLRYAISLDEDCDLDATCENLTNGWRRYRIPLYESQYYDILSEGSETPEQILENVQMTRIWMGNLPNGVTQSEVLLAQVSLNGHTWEESTRNTEYEVVQPPFDDGTGNPIVLPPQVSDSNTLQIDVINNHEHRDSYIASPNTQIERDTETEDPLREQSLVLEYQNLHPGEQVYATRLFGGDRKDLTLYDRLLMEVYPDPTSIPAFSKQFRARFALQMGHDNSNQESSNYYEVEVHLDTNIDAGNIQEANNIWNNHQISFSLTELARLKTLDEWVENNIVYDTIPHTNRPAETMRIGVVGNPSFSNINWMRFVIKVDSNAQEFQSGRIWINDMRVEGVHRSIGTSLRTSFQADFSDFWNVAGNLNATNGDFTTLTETQKTPAQSNTEASYNLNTQVFLNKFLPDVWGVNIPLSVKSSGSITRPYTKPSSDIPLNNRDLNSFFGSLSPSSNPLDASRYQTRKQEESLNISYRKNKRSKNFLVQSLTERPAVEYSYSLSSLSSPTKNDTITTYNSKLSYDLSPYQSKPWKPLGFSKQWKWIPQVISNFEFTPYPNQIKLIVGDLSYSHQKSLTKTIDDPENFLRDSRYTIEIGHGFDIDWKMFRFLDFNYRISVKRDFDDHAETFTGQNFFSNSNNGLFAWKLLLAEDSSGARESIGSTYGILANEFERSQNFQMNYNPKLLTWLSTNGQFSSNYQHTRKAAVDPGTSREVPEHFRVNQASHTIRLSSSLNFRKLMRSMDKSTQKISWLSPSIKTLKKATEKIRLSSISTNYSIRHSFNNQRFSIQELNQRGYSSFDVFAYQLGAVYGPGILLSPSRFKNEILLGRPGRSAHFLDYKDAPMGDTNSLDMNHGITREWDNRLGSFTIPYIDLNLSSSLKWSMTYTLYQDPNQGSLVDTTVVWPHITVNAGFSSLEKKLGLKRYLKSLSSNSAYVFKKTHRFNALNPGREVVSIEHGLNPFLRLSGTTKKDVYLDNNTTFSLTLRNEVPKILADSTTIYTFKQFTLPTYQADTNKLGLLDLYTYRFSNTFTASYNLKTSKGIQLWKYYWLLKSDIELKATLRGDYNRTLRWEYRNLEGNIQREREKTLDQTILEVKPEVKYNFSSTTDLNMLLRYEFEREAQTDNKDTKHTIEAKAVFTMRF